MSVASHVFDEVAALKKGWAIAEACGFELSDDLGSDELLMMQMSTALCEPDHVDASALVWVAPEMVDLLLHAAVSLPIYEFSRSVLPWPKALVLGSKPFMTVHDPIYDRGDIPVVALHWSDGLADVRNGVVIINGLAHHHGPDVLGPITLSTLREGANWEDISAKEERLGTYSVKPEVNKVLEMGRLLCALWLLLKQRVAIQRRAVPHRGERRRWLREMQGPLPEVTIVELRRPLNTEPFKGESGFVDWSHRWIVDGHWRNQYHPSTQLHVPTWIAPYVKGPDDKPLIVSRKVHAWTR